MKLALENVQKSYGARSIVNRVSLSFQQGEIVGLLGPNGAGKTTTFYMATGLEKPDEGKVWLDELAQAIEANHGKTCIISSEFYLVVKNL